MCVKAFDDGTIPDTETLSLTHLPDRVRWPTVTVDPAKLNHRKPILYVCFYWLPVVSWRRAKYKQMYGLKSTLTVSW